jgi:hypothetical protein
MAKGKGGFLGQDGLNAPDQATGVSATAGNTQATVSFTAPENTGASAITGYRVQSDNGDGYTNNLFSLSVASYDNVSFSVNSQDLVPMDLRFKPDGTKMYVLGRGNDAVYQYSLSTAFDVSTASYDSVLFYVNSQDANPFAFEFKPDGSKFYMVGNSNDTVYQYSLSTAWDMSTASYDSVSFSIASQDTAPYGVTFNDDGSKMYILGLISDSVFQYSLSTAYDLSTASYDSVSFSFTSQDTAPLGFVFNNDGTKAFMSGNTGDSVYQYTLSTAYDISTLSYDSVSFSVSQEPNPQGITFNNDGSKMYILGSTSDKVFQYTSGSGGIYPTESPITVYGLTNGTSYTFNVWAINSSGWSAPSEASDSVTPAFARGLFGGGYTSTNTIDYIDITNTGNATDFGDLTVSRYGVASCSSETRGLWAGGYANLDVIDYVTIASTGNATDFGNLTVGLRDKAGCSSSTRGLFGGGQGATSDVIDYVTIASAGNAIDFGNLTVNRAQLASFSSPTRGVWAGGYSSTNVIDYVTIASTGNATDFGDLTSARYGVAGCSNSTRGLIGGGYANLNNIDYVTIATTGNAADFGDLTVALRDRAGCASTTRGVFAGGQAANSNVIDYVEIGTLGNAIDFGNLTLARSLFAGCSSNHGGLQ